MSMLPPQRRGGTIEWLPGSAGATPIVPGNGANASVMSSANRTRPLADLRDPQPRLAELVGKQAEAGNDRRPAPGMRTQLEDLDGEHVAWLRTAHEHRTGHGVDPVEVQRGDIGGRRVGGELVAGSVGGLELHGLAGLDLERRRDRVVPGERNRLGPDPVQ
jgi:hypothetical protein